MTYVPVPEEIHAEVCRQQEKMGWPERVPHYVEFKRDGHELWTDFTKTTISDCEQIGEYHQRQGSAAIVRWMKHGKTGTLRRAAYHMLRARILRCRYFTLAGTEDVTEADMPFPVMSKDEIERMQSELPPPTTS